MEHPRERAQTGAAKALEEVWRCGSAVDWSEAEAGQRFLRMGMSVHRSMAVVGMAAGAAAAGLACMAAGTSPVGMAAWGLIPGASLGMSVAQAGHKHAVAVAREARDAFLKASKFARLKDLAAAVGGAAALAGVGIHEQEKQIEFIALALSGGSQEKLTAFGRASMRACLWIGSWRRHDEQGLSSAARILMGREIFPLEAALAESREIQEELDLCDCKALGRKKQRL